MTDDEKIEAAKALVEDICILFPGKHPEVILMALIILSSKHLSFAANPQKVFARFCDSVAQHLALYEAMDAEDDDETLH